MEEIQVLNTEVVKDSQFESQIDIAKRYPRDLTRIINNSIAIVTMDRETAETCNYSLPRGGKTLSGASVHLARIIVQQYGNLRVESRVSKVDPKQVHAEAVCFDLESNVAVKVTTSKSILNKHGQRFKEDMIIVTGKAAAAIAYRNAVFSVIPKAIVDKVYKSAMNKITGNITNEEQLIKRRTDALKKFKDDYAVEERELLEHLGLNTINQIDQQQIVNMIGMFNSLKDGEFSVDEMFGRKKKEEPKPFTDKEYQLLIKDLKSYNISLASALEKHNNSLNDIQKKEVVKAGTITDEKLTEITQLVIDEKKSLKHFEFYLTDEQFKVIEDAMIDNEMQKQN
jgi:hypothetical protein